MGIFARQWPRSLASFAFRGSHRSTGVTRKIPSCFFSRGPGIMYAA